MHVRMYILMLIQMKYMYVLVSWLMGGSKRNLCVHEPCSTGHQTGFIVKDYVIAREQGRRLVNTFSIAYNMLY